MSLPRAIQQCLDSQSAHAALNAFVACASPTALLSQHQTFAALGDPCPGPLHGRLIAVKDNVCTADFPTTAASRGLAGFSSAFDATVVGRVREAGGLVAGKTNLDEFGMGSHSANSTFGAVRPPRSTYSAGGSSGGSAVAAQTGACWACVRLLLCSMSARADARHLQGAWHRHRRFHSPPRCLYWHRRLQADIRTAVAVGCYSLCELTRHSRHCQPSCRSRGRRVQ